MNKRKQRFKPKSREMIREAADIVRNSQDDDAAIEFLRDTLDDDFPDMELGTMDLHEAIKVLDGEEAAGDKEAIRNLNEALGDFMKRQNKPEEKKAVKRKRRKKRRKKK